MDLIVDAVMLNKAYDEGAVPPFEYRIVGTIALPSVTASNGDTSLNTVNGMSFEVNLLVTADAPPAVSGDTISVS